MKNLINYFRYLKRKLDFFGIKRNDKIYFVYYDENNKPKLIVGRFIRINSNGSFYVTDIESKNHKKSAVVVFDKHTMIREIGKITDI